MSVEFEGSVDLARKETPVDPGIAAGEGLFGFDAIRKLTNLPWVAASTAQIVEIAYKGVSRLAHASLGEALKIGPEAIQPGPVVQPALPGVSPGGGI